MNGAVVPRLEGGGGCLGLRVLPSWSRHSHGTVMAQPRHSHGTVTAQSRHSHGTGGYGRCLLRGQRVHVGQHASGHLLQLAVLLHLCAVVPVRSVQHLAGIERASGRSVGGWGACAVVCVSAMLDVVR